MGVPMVQGGPPLLFGVTYNPYEFPNNWVSEVISPYLKGVICLYNSIFITIGSKRPTLHGL